jgi:hypothetical protein
MITKGKKIGKLTLTIACNRAGQGVWQALCECGVATTITVSQILSKTKTKCSRCKNK